MYLLNCGISLMSNIWATTTTALRPIASIDAPRRARVSGVARVNARAVGALVLGGGGGGSAADAGDSPSLSTREKKVSWSLVVSGEGDCSAAVYFHIKFGGGEENYFQCQLSVSSALFVTDLVLE